jgi:4-aminobutyrate aminotransferase-like enzyme
MNKQNLKLINPQKTISEKELLELENKYCSHGDTVHYMEVPKIFERSKGSFMYDAEGKEFLDIQMWYSACNLGYANERINNAVKAQLDRLPQVASQYLHKEKIELATKLAQGMEHKFAVKGRIHFNVGGSQAIEDSLKLVRNYTGGKSLMFAFEGGYHGRTLGASAITSSYRYRRRYGHFGDRAMFIPFPYYFRRHERDMNEQEYGSWCVKQFERLFESEYNGVWDPKVGKAEYAAFYVEPIQGTGGYVVPPKNFFPELKKVLDKYGILLVVDEIQMGFYRTGKMWSIEHFGVTPDVLVFGKALTNGLNPLSGVWAKEDMINPGIFPPGSTHSTFASNPMGTSAGLEVLKTFEENDYEKSISEKGKYFLDGLKELQKQYKEIGHVDGLGLALCVEVCEKDGFTPNKKLNDMLAEEGLKGDLPYKGKKYGLVLDLGGYYKNVITIAPSLDISYEEIDMAVALLGELFKRCTK